MRHIVNDSFINRTISSLIKPVASYMIIPLTKLPTVMINFFSFELMR